MSKGKPGKKPLGKWTRASKRLTLGRMKELDEVVRRLIMPLVDEWYLGQSKRADGGTRKRRKAGWK